MGNENQTSQQDAQNQESQASKDKMVPERDLIAAKKGLESQLDEAKAAHAKELDSVRIQLSETQTKLFSSEAKVKDIEEKLSQASKTGEETSKLKQQLEAAQKAAESFQSKALEFRRRHIAATFNVAEDFVKTKTMEQLDAFEEALKSVAAARGTGNYAIGAGGGGARTETPMERAIRVLKEAEEKGHVYSGGIRAAAKQEQ